MRYGDLHTSFAGLSQTNAVPKGVCESSSGHTGQQDKNTTSFSSGKRGTSCWKRHALEDLHWAM